MSNICINMNEILMPATANGYSHSARFPPFLSNNLKKQAFILNFSTISKTNFSDSCFKKSKWMIHQFENSIYSKLRRKVNKNNLHPTNELKITVTLREHNIHTGYDLAKNNRFSSEIKPQPLQETSTGIGKKFEDVNYWSVIIIVFFRLKYTVIT